MYPQKIHKTQLLYVLLHFRRTLSYIPEKLSKKEFITLF